MTSPERRAGSTWARAVAIGALLGAGPAWSAAAVTDATPGPSGPRILAPAGRLVTIGLGGSGFRNAPTAGHFELGFQFAPVWRGLRPSVGALGSSAGDSFYYAGLSADAPLFRHWGITPQFVAGAYEQGGGMNLGGALEFRTSFELYRTLGPTLRLGASWNHISNAGFFDRNPGRESLFFSVGILR